MVGIFFSVCPWRKAGSDLRVKVCGPPIAFMTGPERRVRPLTGYPVRMLTSLPLSIEYEAKRPGYIQWIDKPRLTVCCKNN